MSMTHIHRGGGVVRISAGPLADRPAPGNKDAWYMATDAGQIFYDDGSEWVFFPTSSGGAPAVHGNDQHSPNMALDSEFKDHSARHESGGADEIDVSDLSGELADPQPPKTHTHAASETTSGTFADPRISQSSVKQHEAALSIPLSQVPDSGRWAAKSERKVVDVSGGSNVDISADSAEYSSIELTGTLTANIVVSVSNTPGMVWVVYNNTSGDFTLKLNVPGQFLSRAITQGGQRILGVFNGSLRNILGDISYYDGANIIDISSMGSSVTLKEADLSYRTLVIAGAITQDVDLIFHPNGSFGPWHLVNITTGGYELNLYYQSTGNPKLTIQQSSGADPRAQLIVSNQITSSIQEITGEWALKTEITKIDMDGVTSLTLTPNQELTNILSFENLTADATVTVSGARRGPWWLLNISSSYKIDFSGSAGDPVEVPPAAQVPYAPLVYHSLSTGSVALLQSPSTTGDGSGLTGLTRSQVTDAGTADAERIITGTTHTITPADEGAVLICTNDKTVRITIDANANQDLSARAEITVVQRGQGTVHFVSAAGVTIDGPVDTQGKHTAVRLYQREALDHWQTLDGTEQTPFSIDMETTGAAETVTLPMTFDGFGAVGSEPTTVPDLAGSNDGTNNGATVAYVDGAAGLEFDASKQQYVHADSSPVSAYPFLLEAKAAAYSVHTGVILSIDASPSDHYHLIAFRQDGTRLRARAWSRSGGGSGPQGGELNINQEYMISGYFESPTSRRLYIDGQLIDTETAEVNIDLPLSDVLIGLLRLDSPAWWLDGFVREARVWDVSGLTRSQVEQQITDNLDKTLTGNEPGLVGYWPMYDDIEVDIDWGDGTVDTGVRTDNPSHEYAVTDTYTIEITGICDEFRFNNGGDATKLTAINSGGTGFYVNRMDFYGCSNLTSADYAGLYTSHWTDMRNLHRSNSSLATLGLSMLDTSGVTSMSNMLRNCSSLTSDPGLVDFDVTALTDATSMAQTANSMLSESEYNAILVAWEAQDVNDSVTVHFGDAKHSGSGTTARTALINDHSWSFTDGGAA